MAFRKVEKGPEEIGAFWKPEEKGDAIEGNIYDFEEGTFNGRKTVQINLYLGEDENGEPKMTLLPNHADLKRSYSGLEVGDYIRVEVTDKIEPKGKSEYPKFKYDVFVDDDRKVTWDDSSNDDYYAD